MVMPGFAMPIKGPRRLQGKDLGNFVAHLIENAHMNGFGEEVNGMSEKDVANMLISTNFAVIGDNSLSEIIEAVKAAREDKHL